MNIAIASDHAGFDLKTMLITHLRMQGHIVQDLGPASDESVDYPDFADVVARSVANGVADYGVLMCGTGIGMAIAANKIDGVRAASITSPAFAKLAREHNDANIVTLSARFVEPATNIEIVDVFLNTSFAGDRHALRIDKISRLEAR